MTVRGKRKLGYDFDAELTFTNEGKKVTVKITDMCDDEDDCGEFVVQT